MLTLMRLFTIRFRMLSAIAVVLGLLSILGGVGLWSMFRMQALSQDFMDHTFADAGRLSRLQFELGRTRVAEKEMVIHYESATAVKDAHGRWQISVRNALEQAQALSSAGSQTVARAAQTARTHIDGYAAAMAPVVTQLSGGAVPSATVGNSLLTKANQEFAELEKQLLALEDLVQKQAGAAVKEQEDASGTSKLLFALALVLTIVVVGPLTWLNMLSICKPVEQSQGISSVNQTVTEIDQMTQQNAALVEQSAAAAESLREQAERLAQLVRQFRLREGAVHAGESLRICSA